MPPMLVENYLSEEALQRKGVKIYEKMKVLFESGRTPERRKAHVDPETGQRHVTWVGSHSSTAFDLTTLEVTGDHQLYRRSAVIVEMDVTTTFETGSGDKIPLAPEVTDVLLDDTLRTITTEGTVPWTNDFESLSIPVTLTTG